MQEFYCDGHRYGISYVLTARCFEREQYQFGPESLPARTDDVFACHRQDIHLAGYCVLESSFDEA